METYNINGSTLTIPDSGAFGFTGSRLPKGHAFAVVFNEFAGDRRTYNIYEIVIKHQESGRFFAREYSTHEMEGFEWEPGEGRNIETTWTEVFPHEVTTIVYKPAPK